MKKTLAFLISAGIAAMQFMPVAAQVTVTEDEETSTVYADNSTIQNAQSVSINGSFSRQTTAANNYYTFTLSEAGKLTLKVRSEKYCTVYLYDENRTQIDSAFISGTGTNGGATEVVDYYLNPGTYYICVGTSSYRPATFTVQTSFTSTGVSFNESQSGSNNSAATASSISVDKTYTGQIGLIDKTNYYKLELPSSGKVVFSVQIKNGESVGFELFDCDLQTIGYSTTDYSTSSGGSGTTTHTYYLNKGTYYVDMSISYREDVVYTLGTAFTAANETITEDNLGSNNNLGQAATISLNKSYNGMLATNDTEDFYKFNLPSQQEVTLSLFWENGIRSTDLYLYLYNSAGRSISVMSGSENFATEKTVLLDAGDYYLEIRSNPCFYRFSVNTPNGGNSTSTNNNTNSNSTAKSGWSKNSSGIWQYYYDNGELAKNGWHRISGYWYYFDANGNMQTGWLEEDGVKYYLHSSGAMSSSEWVKIDGKYYYFCLNGSMATDRWVLYNGKWYYILNNGQMVSSTIKTIDGKLYKFNSDGSMVSSKWVKNGDSWQYFGSSGALVKNGWVLTGGTWYYVDPDGNMVTGWQTIKDVRYYFDSNGAMASGQWKLIDGYYYYFYTSGALATNTVIDGLPVDSNGRRTV